MVFALAGNQNSGKTTLFNQLTGSNQHVGNFPGVTVDKKEGVIRDHTTGEHHFVRAPGGTSATSAARYPRARPPQWWTCPASTRFRRIPAKKL